MRSVAANMTREAELYLAHQLLSGTILQQNRFPHICTVAQIM
jgi:hypothetical protein